ncbi:hypothetical protein KAR91_73495 [Candidatus Pacearchaeota archaeon]|nr:hypothetical protein [Candidatus Pacearchaeota archaeon]
MHQDNCQKHWDNELYEHNDAYIEAVKFYKGNQELLDQHILFFAKKGICVAKPDHMLLACVVDDDTWFIGLAVGKNAFEVFYWSIPFYLPYVSWVREKRDGGKQIYKYSWEKLERKFTNGQFRKQQEASTSRSASSNAIKPTV